MGDKTGTVPSVSLVFVFISKRWIQKKKQKTKKKKKTLSLLSKVFSAQVTLLNSIVYDVLYQKLSSMYLYPILMKETRIAPFSFTHVCLHHCENTVAVNIAGTTSHSMLLSLVISCVYNHRKTNRNRQIVSHLMRVKLNDHCGDMLVFTIFSCIKIPLFSLIALHYYI